MILGFTGSLGSGKTTIADYLKKRGFNYITLSDLVREEAVKRNLPIEREILQNTGNEMREKYGNNYWAKKALEKINLNENWIIDGIRNIGEIEELKKIKEFILLGFDAPFDERLKRLIVRKKYYSERKISDPEDIEKIRKLEARDRGVNEPLFGQQVEKCLSLADYKIDTNSEIDDTIKKVEEILFKKI